MLFICVSLWWVGKVGNYAARFAVAFTHMCNCVHTHTHTASEMDPTCRVEFDAELP